MTTTAKKGFIVRSGEDRAASPLRFLNGRFDCKVSGKDTDGAFCSFDTWRFKPGGPPLHLHFETDEWFLIVEGEFRFKIGDDEFIAHAGDSVFGPRGVPHQFRNLSETGRMFVTFYPAGTMEEFFAAGMVDPNSQAFKDLSLKHGMDVVGPALTD